MIKTIAMIILALWPQMVTSFGGYYESVVDLTQTLNSESFYWPTQIPYQLRILENGTRVDNNNEKYWFQVDEIHMATHTGTHLDAPCHYAKGKWCVSDIPLSHLMDRPVAVIDVVDKCRASRDYEFNVIDIIEWERRNGKIPYDGVILVRTGWARFWPNRLKYIGTESKNRSLAHFPGIAQVAAQWLTENRKIVGIGIDAAAVDGGQSPYGATHRTFLPRNIYQLENVAQTIDELPETGARLTVLPAKVEGASGVTVRLIAKINRSAVKKI